MSRKIFKYKLSEQDVNERGELLLRTGGDQQILHVGPQYTIDEFPTVWATVDPDAESTLRLRIVPTGGAVPDSGWLFVGSCVCYGGSFVWHVYRERV